jgi:hypothetical protein
MVTVSLDSPSCEATLFDPVSVVYRDATRQTKGLYRLKYVGALWSGLACLSRYNSGWFCHICPTGCQGMACCHSRPPPPLPHRPLLPRTLPHLPDFPSTKSIFPVRRPQFPSCRHSHSCHRPPCRWRLTATPKMYADVGVPRFIKLDFAKYDGIEDPLNWLTQCE